jgi:hypothetical protein
LCAVATTFISILGHFSVLKTTSFDLSTLADAAVFGVIALWIWKRWRLAAVCGLVLYLVERIDMWLEFGVKNPVVALILTLGFINSVRATFWMKKHYIASPGPGNSRVEH